MESQNNLENYEPKPDDISRVARNMGIISFFFGVVILSIITLKLVKEYKRTHNGKHCKQSKVALICGIISLIIWTAIIAYAVIYCYIWYGNRV